MADAAELAACGPAARVPRAAVPEAPAEQPRRRASADAEAGGEAAHLEAELACAQRALAELLPALLSPAGGAALRGGGVVVVGCAGARRVAAALAALGAAPLWLQRDVGERNGDSSSSLGGGSDGSDDASVRASAGPAGTSGSELSSLLSGGAETEGECVTTSELPQSTACRTVTLDDSRGASPCKAVANGSRPRALMAPVPASTGAAARSAATAAASTALGAAAALSVEAAAATASVSASAAAAATATAVKLTADATGMAVGAFAEYVRCAACEGIPFECSRCC